MTAPDSSAEPDRVGSPAVVPVDLTDAAYTAIGFGILGIQRLQVTRRRLRRRMEREGRLSGATDTDLTALFERIDRGLDELGAVLPELVTQLLEPLLGNPDTGEDVTDHETASTMNETQRESTS